MLETIRAYASERFAAGADAEVVRERHYRVYLAVAQRHGTDQALLGVRGKENLARLDAEVDNLQAAVRWALDRRHYEHALAMVAALGSYWLVRDRHADAVNWIDQALSLADTDAHPALRVRALCDKGWVCGGWDAETKKPRCWPRRRPSHAGSMIHWPSPQPSRSVPTARRAATSSLSRARSPTRRLITRPRPATSGRSQAH
jgi:hypothetical protein